MAKDLAVVLNNGSVNSAVVTALAAQKYRPILVFADLTGNAASRSRGAFEQQVNHFKPYRDHLLVMPLAGPSRSQAPGTGKPAAAYQTGTSVTEQLLDLLPLLGAGIRLACQYQASALYVGLRVGGGKEDLSQATEYIQVLNELIQLPCHHAELEIVAPLLELDPWQVVDLGFQVAAPFDLTWSCLEDGADPCWNCRGCQDREAAFQQAAKADPLRTLKKL